jgi:hypothetical protein
MENIKLRIQKKRKEITMSFHEFEEFIPKLEEVPNHFVDLLPFSQIRSADQAFQFAVQRALYNHGHSGDTGTIAEKEDDGFRLSCRLKMDEVFDEGKLAQIVIPWDQFDKDGEAGCIEVHTDKKVIGWLFFGKAAT